MEKDIYRDKIIQIFIMIELVLAVFINFCTVILNNKTLVSVCFALNFFIFLLIFIIFLNSFKNISAYYLILIVLSMINIFFSYVLNNTANFKNIIYIRCYIFFIVTNSFYYIISKIQVSKKLYLFTINCCFLTVLFNLGSYYILKNREIVANGITLNFPNPNLTGLWISVSFMFGIIKVVETHSKIRKIIFFLLIILLLPIVVKTLSRNVIISLVFLGLLVIYGLVFKINKMSKYILLLILVFPFIFCFIYLACVNMPIMNKFYFLQSEGKTLNSRLYIWDYGLKHFLHYPLIGSYSQLIFDGNGGAQLHNTALDISSKYGIIVYLLFIKVNYNILKRINRNFLKKIQYLALCCFLSIIVQGIFEGGLYAGYYGLEYLIGGFLVIAKGYKR